MIETRPITCGQIVITALIMVLLCVTALLFTVIESQAQNDVYAVWLIDGQGFGAITKLNARLPDEDYRLVWDSERGYEYPTTKAAYHWFSLIMSDDSVMHIFRNSEMCVGFWTSEDVIGSDDQPHPSRGAAVYDCDLLQSFVEK